MISNCLGHCHNKINNIHVDPFRCNKVMKIIGNITAINDPWMVAIWKPSRGACVSSEVMVNVSDSNARRTLSTWALRRIQRFTRNPARFPSDFIFKHSVRCLLDVWVVGRDALMSRHSVSGVTSGVTALCAHLIGGGGLGTQIGVTGERSPLLTLC